MSLSFFIFSNRSLKLSDFKNIFYELKLSFYNKSRTEHKIIQNLQFKSESDAIANRYSVKHGVKY